jgi:hypothetical protein
MFGEGRVGGVKSWMPSLLPKEPPFSGLRSAKYDVNLALRPSRGHNGLRFDDLHCRRKPRTGSKNSQRADNAFGALHGTTSVDTVSSGEPDRRVTILSQAGRTATTSWKQKRVSKQAHTTNKPIAAMCGIWLRRKVPVFTARTTHPFGGRTAITSISTR